MTEKYNELVETAMENNEAGRYTEERWDDIEWMLGEVRTEIKQGTENTEMLARADWFINQ